MQLSDFKILTFDCYGTLIDWETGISNALTPLAERAGKILTKDQKCEAHAKFEAAQEAETPTLRYSEVLEKVHDRIAQEWGVPPIPAESLAYGQSVKDWPAFPDSAEALQYLKKHFKLVILSNVDLVSFRASNPRLQVDFDQVLTAEEIGSYKPDLRNFEYMLQKMEAAGYRKEDILHTAESLFHDHLPANKMGLASAWIHRRAGKSGHGATFPPESMPKYTFRFNSLGEMAKSHQLLLQH